MESEVFDELVALGPERASKALHEDMDALGMFCSELLERSCPLSGWEGPGGSLPPDIGGTSFAAWIMWLATSPLDGENPEGYMKRAQVRQHEKSLVLCANVPGFVGRRGSRFLCDRADSPPVEMCALFFGSIWMSSQQNL